MAAEHRDSSSASPTGSHENEKPTAQDEPISQTRSRSKEKQDDSSEPSQPKKGPLAFLKKLWTKTGLKPIELLIMAKGGLPPTIALAFYQAQPVANTFTTLGYLVAIISIIGFCIMPRARFLQTLLLNLLSSCIGAAMALLMIFCTVQARLHTTTPAGELPSGQQSPTPGASLVMYNSSASAVSAIWLFFQIYLVNTIKAKYPQFNFPAIMYSIFTIVAATYSPQFPTMAAGESFVQRLLEAFLTGLALATGVSLFILPTTSRKVVFVDFTMYFGQLKGALDTYKKWLEAMQTPENMSKLVSAREPGKPSPVPEAEAVKKGVQGLLAIHGKLQTDMTFAKREVALGKLGPDDLKEMNKKIRSVMLPIVGLASLVTIFERLAESRGWTEEKIKEGLDAEDEEYRNDTISGWSATMKIIHEPVEQIMTDMKDGMDHIMLRLELKKPEEKGKGDKSQDIEDEAQSTRPGSDGFADYLEKRSHAFHNGKEEALRDWCKRKGIELPPNFFEHPETAKFYESEETRSETYERHQRRQRQLYALLYIEYLLYHTSQAILAFVRFADERVASGKLDKTRLVVPGWKRMRKWAFSVFKEEDDSNEHELSDTQTSENTVSLGDAYKDKRDPEHLPPSNTIEKIGNFIRIIPNFFRSSESAFGLRAAIATMCVGIVNYLADTQYFFTQNRLLWAMIMIAISMTPTAGQSVFNFLCRIGGTVVALVSSLIIFYIVDGHTAGMIVFFWLFASSLFYIILKKPAFVVAGMISIVTISLIIGYELEARVIGTQAVQSNGQEYLPVYLLAPYRLATVAGGLFVAWIWTIFPFPISEHSQVRQDLGGALYLLANFYSVVHETVLSRIRGNGGDESAPGSPGYQLSKHRLKIFGKVTMLLSSLKQHLNFVKWQIPIGGKFPQQRYQIIIQLVENITNYIALIGYASSSFSSGARITNDTETAADSQWSTDFRRLMVDADLTSHEITTLLSLLSASIKGGTPLPPYLQPPQPYGLSTKMESMDPDILSVRHINEPGYAAFAVLQVSSRCIVADLTRLLKEVKGLVGELDFSFHVISTKKIDSNETLAESSGEDILGRAKTKGD